MRVAMRRSPCSSKGLNRKAWTATEDKMLTEYIKAHGEGNWRNISKEAGQRDNSLSRQAGWFLLR